MEAGKKEQEEESSFRLSYFVGHELGEHFVLVDSLGVGCAEVELCVGGLQAFSLLAADAF